MSEVTSSEEQVSEFSAWNPGIDSEIPEQYRDLETIFRPENTYNSAAENAELERETGLRTEELILFKPARIAMQEVIVRVTANLLVREGGHEEDLGINFRRITWEIFDRYVAPELEDIERQFNQLQTRLEQRIREIISADFFTTAEPQAKPGVLQKLFARKKPAKKPVEAASERESRIIAGYRQAAQGADDVFELTVFRSLNRVLGCIANRRGFLGRDLDFLVRISSTHACYRLASREIGERIEQLMKRAVEEQGYELIPDARHPVLISLKGTSAAGKSSLRPMLSDMYRKIGIAQDGYGTISPDIWRKLLLDYGQLGEAYKYAGRLTSYEVNVIDARLDRYIRAKSNKYGSLPHLVVDRFRFDSFESEKVGRLIHNTYVKYIETMFMFFVITPPEATVERGWKRGLKRGRYKSVEDFLAHSVEAYAGIPKLLFKWTANEKPKFHFEFLDNSVPEGVFPALIARGTQGRIDIRDPIAFVNIERYQKINVLAKSPEAVYPTEGQLDCNKNLGFLRNCVRKFHQVNFVDINSGSTYLRATRTRFEVLDSNTWSSVLLEPELLEIFSELCPKLCEGVSPATPVSSAVPGP